MAKFEINPRYQEALRHFKCAEDFLALSGAIICGHPDRHVMQLSLPTASGTHLDCYLKREHVIRWRQRWANAWAGFGFASNAAREVQTLKRCYTAAVNCPDWLAWGEDRGRAFLLLQQVPGVALPEYLRSALAGLGRHRREVAKNLGESLAHLHDAGFVHGDLYAKHVVIDPASCRVTFLDWQRARRLAFVDWPSRWRDLAALDATLADQCAGLRDRLACLHAYLQATVPIRVPRPFRRQTLSTIHGHSQILQQRRRIREQRQTRSAIGSQQLLALDGERLCVTPEFQQSLGGAFPSWLHEEPDAPAKSSLRVPGAARPTLMRRRSTTIFEWWRSIFLGQRPCSPELQQAGLLFRLQRCGVVTPKLLAVGQRQNRPWRMDSFLLTDGYADAVPLPDWLSYGPEADGDAILHETARVLHAIHESGCHGIGGGWRFLVRSHDDGRFEVMVGTVAGLHSGRSTAQQRHRDLKDLLNSLPLQPAKVIRFLRDYEDSTSLSPDLHRLALLLTHEHGSSAGRESIEDLPPREVTGRAAA